MKKKIQNAFQFLLLATWLVSLIAMSPPTTLKVAKVDVKKSNIVWIGKKITGEHSGNISLSGGSLNIENNKIKGGNFEIDLKSIVVTDITDKEGNARLLGHLKSEDFFAVEKFPKANLIITKITPKSNDEYEVAGNLTIKGITNDISFPATIKSDKDKITAKAKIIVDRTKYGIKYRSKNFFENVGDKAIYDDFELNVNLIAE